MVEAFLSAAQVERSASPVGRGAPRARPSARRTSPVCIEMKSPSASAHRRSPARSSPRGEDLAALDRARSAPRSAARCAAAWASGSSTVRRPVMPGRAGQRLRGAEHLVERGGHEAAVHAARRPLVGGAEGGRARPCASPSSHSSIGGASGLARPEHRAVVEERERLARVGRLGEALVDRRVGVRGEALGQRLEVVGAACRSTSTGALVCTRRCSTPRDGVGQAAGSARRDARRTAAASRQLAERARPSPASRACLGVGRSTGRRVAHAASSRSTTSGRVVRRLLALAGVAVDQRPLRRVRQRRASRARGRCACPMPLWKLPAR